MKYEYRRSEWYMAWAMLGWGLTLLWPGNTFGSGNFSAFAHYGTEVQWAISAIGVALFRGAALWVNGHWRHTPTIRLCMSVLSIGIWSMTCYLLFASFAGDEWVAPSTGIWIYFMLMVMEIEGAFSAGRDRQRRRDDV